MDHDRQTSDGSDDAPTRRNDVNVHKLDDEALLYDPAHGAVHRFNTSTLFVWDLCDGTNDRNTIAVALAQRFAIEPQQAQSNVDRVLMHLQTLGLLD